MAPSEPTTFDCDTVFLLGSGINTNSWVPVRAAAQEFVQGVYPHVTFTDDEQVNYWMAWWVFQRRMAELRKKRSELTPAEAEQMKSLDDSDLGLRKNIAASLLVATEHRDFFRLRHELREVLDQRRWGDNLCFLTTNWDRNLEVELGLPDDVVTHIHGNVSDASCIYLPSEISSEPYRPDEANAYMKMLHAKAWQAIHGARQLCIYGLSLSPLDAELAAVIGVGLGAEPREASPSQVYICNVGDRELDKVAWRVTAAAHPKVKLDIHRVPLQGETDPRVPEGWYLQPR
jgi:hypothetical protein